MRIAYSNIQLFENITILLLNILYYISYFLTHLEIYLDSTFLLEEYLTISTSQGSLYFFWINYDMIKKQSSNFLPFILGPQVCLTNHKHRFETFFEEIIQPRSRKKHSSRKVFFTYKIG